MFEKKYGFWNTFLGFAIGMLCSLLCIIFSAIIPLLIENIIIGCFLCMVMNFTVMYSISHIDKLILKYISNIQHQ